MKHRVMTRTMKLAMMAFVLTVVLVGVAHSNSTGPVTGRSGIPAGGGFPAELTCNSAGCHDGRPLNPDTQGRVTLAGVPDNYIPGRRYTVQFSVTHPDSSRRRWGFQVSVISATTFTQAGTLVVTDAANTSIRIAANRQYLGHTLRGTNLGQIGGRTWTFDWVAPATNVGDVNFYGSGNAANGDGTNLGDFIYNPTPNPVATAKGQFSFVNIGGSANVAPTRRGIATGDYDKDGDDDLFLADAYALYRNNGNGTFTNVSPAAGLTAGDALGQAAAWGDVDGDGDVDLYVVNAGSDRLYRNNGNGTFTDVSADAGISDEAVGHAAAWVDVSGDGQLDLYVVNDGQDALYINQMGMLSKTAPAMNGTAESANGRGIAVGDYNNDGRPDLFIANEGESALYRNNGAGLFTNVTAMVGIQALNARAATWLDYDGDGDQDLFVVTATTDALYRNNGDGSFTDVTVAAGLMDMAAGIAVAVADYDRDNDADLFVANDGQDFLYRNNGNGTFNEVAPFSGMTDMAAGGAAAWLDVTGDGLADLFVGRAEGSNFLYRNPGRSGPPPSSSPSDESFASRLARLVKNWLGERG